MLPMSLLGFKTTMPNTAFHLTTTAGYARFRGQVNLNVRSLRCAMNARERRTLKQRLILWSNRLRLDMMVRKKGWLFQVILHERFKPIIRTIKKQIRHPPIMSTKLLVFGKT